MASRSGSAATALLPSRVTMRVPPEMGGGGVLHVTAVPKSGTGAWGGHGKPGEPASKGIAPKPPELEEPIEPPSSSVAAPLAEPATDRARQPFASATAPQRA